MQPFETRRVVVLSTVHVPQETWATLFALPLTQWPVAGGPTGVGACIWVPEHGEDRETEAFPGLFKPLAWARSHGFEYILFDRDADPRDDLPKYHQEEGA